MKTAPGVCRALLLQVAVLLFSTLGAIADDPKPGRYTGTMTIKYTSRNTGDLGVTNKVTYKVSGEGNPSDNPGQPGIVLYLLAPPEPGEIVPSRGKITSVNFRVTPRILSFVDAANNRVDFPIPLATEPRVKGNSVFLPETNLGSVTIAGFHYEYALSFRVQRVR
ncbi:hypothetical protein ACXR0O_29320 [Verrucomicrobiota bacterium sgz303538]